MTDAELRALSAIRFNSAATPADVWSSSPVHVAGLHPDVERTVLAGIEDARASAFSSPLGVVIRGQKGVGKTHLLGWVREQIQAHGGYFVLIGLMHGVDFWESTALAVREALSQPMPGGGTQLTVFLHRLARQISMSEEDSAVLAGDGKPTRELLDTFVAALLRTDPQVGRRCRDTARALALYASAELGTNDVGSDYLVSAGQREVPDDQREWGIRRAPASWQALVQEISWLLALTGPTLIAIDQIDALLAQSRRMAEQRESIGRDDDLFLSGIAEGMMALRESTRRTVTVVACLQTSWELLTASAGADTVRDRFRSAAVLSQIRDPELARELVRKRLAAIYAEIGFAPPQPTWPVSPSAFDDRDQYTPRWLLNRVADHARLCLHRNEVRELVNFQEPVDPGDLTEERSALTVDFTEFDKRFDRLRREADVTPVFEPATEDSALPALLAAGLTAWIVERGPAGKHWQLGPSPSAKPALHAMLVHTLDEETDDEEYWAFRGICHPNPRAALKRLQDARRAAGLQEGAPGRALVVLRNVAWSKGPKTGQELSEVRRDGGRDVPITTGDLRTFAALRELLAGKATGLEEWLVSRQPASSTELFVRVLPVADPGWPSDDVDDRTPEPVQSTEVAADRPVVVLGESTRDGSPVAVELESLRKHVAIFAGTGSGKTVLIRRLVEECALYGVSAIVLDPNNDMARLGDPWPEPPGNWAAGDADRAAEYLADTDVVLWTPGHSARPLTFRALPDFAEVRDDPDEFAQAVNVAVDALAPRANIKGAAAKAGHKRAVLREAVEHYGRTGQRSLTGLIALLAELPNRVSSMRNADRLALELADSLTAARVNDPLFGDGGNPVDPAVLLTPPAGKRARLSVLSFVGLPTEEQRQSFVSQLQMELFAWLKRHPAGDRPLGGLLVIDEAQTIAPASPATASTASTIVLASQARKYGLGLVFGTQYPKGLHNQVSGSAATMVIGRLRVPAQVTAAEDIARTTGGSVSRLGNLGAGEFYAAGENFSFREIRTRMCLSHHARSPLPPEEIVRRARTG